MLVGPWPSPITFRKSSKDSPKVVVTLRDHLYSKSRYIRACIPGETQSICDFSVEFRCTEQKTSVKTSQNRRFCDFFQIHRPISRLWRIQRTRSPQHRLVLWKYWRLQARFRPFRQLLGSQIVFENSYFQCFHALQQLVLAMTTTVESKMPIPGVSLGSILQNQPKLMYFDGIDQYWTTLKIQIAAKT